MINGDGNDCQQGPVLTSDNRRTRQRTKHNDSLDMGIKKVETIPKVGMIMKKKKKEKEEEKELKKEKEKDRRK